MRLIWVSKGQGDEAGVLVRQTTLVTKLDIFQSNRWG